jgi:hypothetical protein
MSLEAEFRAAHALYQAGDIAGAEASYRALIEVKPHWAWHNLGVLFLRQGRDAEAEAAFTAALKAEPGNATTRHSLGLVMLRQGRYADGWRLYEYRRQDMTAKLTRPKLPYPDWRGEDLAGKHLVVVREQGFGDQIMFARFLPRLAAMAGKVTFVCSPNLVRLFAPLGVELVAASEAPPPPAADYWIPDCSLGLRLGATLETLSGEAYLAPAPPTAGGGIGVMAAGSPTHHNDRNRTLSGADAARLLALGRDLSPQATGAKDFQATAEIIAGLERVLTVDTAIAHLAAAMGKLTWLMVSHDPDWRWGWTGETTPWYPSVRLFRQPTPGDWRPVLDAVRHALG